MLKRITDYILDEDFKINYITNKLNIVNYLSIVIIEDKQITLKYRDGLLKIRGENLVLVKLLENEVLITGVIKVIELGEK